MPRMHVVDRLASQNGGWRRGTFDVGSKESTLFHAPKQLFSPSFLRFRRSTCITLLCFSISKMVSSAIKMLLNLRPCNPGSLRELQPVQKPLQARHLIWVFDSSALELVRVNQ
jgi:hypothetical protein